MIVLHDEQGSDAWHRSRIGVATASQFPRILTPKTLKPSTQADAYLFELLAEWLIGEPHDSSKSAFMERGTSMEAEARSWYEFDRDVDVQQVGLCLRDDKRAGFSPDGLVGEVGGLEIKVPSAATHVKYLSDPSCLVADYRLQVQGALWISNGREWWDIVSYHPELPKVCERVEPDAKAIGPLSEAVDALVERLTKAQQAFKVRGIYPAEPKVRQEFDPATCCRADAGGGLTCGDPGVVETPDGWRCEMHKESPVSVVG